MKGKLLSVSILFYLLFGSNIFAQQFAYTFNNPSFGGNSFNGSWLLAQAESQNKHTDNASSSSYDRYNQDPLEDFESSLNRQVLSRLSRELIESAFGETAFTDEGRYEIGDFTIEVTQGDDGIIIGIQDFANGGETTIEVPYY